MNTTTDENENTQLARSDLTRMTAAEIMTAKENGQLDELLGIPILERELTADTTIHTRETLAELARHGRHDLIVAAHETNRIKENQE